MFLSYLVTQHRPSCHLVQFKKKGGGQLNGIKQVTRVKTVNAQRSQPYATQCFFRKVCDCKNKYHSSHSWKNCKDTQKIHPPNEVSRIKSLTCIELNTKQGAPSKVMNILQTARELLFDADDIENLGERKSHHFSFVCKFACSRN